MWGMKRKSGWSAQGWELMLRVPGGRVPYLLCIHLCICKKLQSRQAIQARMGSGDHKHSAGEASGSPETPRLYKTGCWNGEGCYLIPEKVCGGGGAVSGIVILDTKLWLTPAQSTSLFCLKESFPIVMGLKRWYSTFLML